MGWVVVVLVIIVVAVAMAAGLVDRRRKERIRRDSTLLVDVMASHMRGEHDARVATEHVGVLGEVAEALNDLADWGQGVLERDDERQRLDGVLLSIDRQVRAELDFDAIALGTALTVQDDLSVDRVWLRVFSDALNVDGFVVSVPEITGHEFPPSVAALFQRVALASWVEGRPVLLPVPEGVHPHISRDEELDIWLELAPLGIDAVLVVPLGVGDEVLGYMILGRGPASLRWRDAEVDVAGEVGVAVGQALANVRIVAREYRVAVEMREVDRQKTELVSNVSHELRTPLTSISGYVEMLRDGEYGELPPDVDATLAIVERSTGRLRELIENLLVASRLELTSTEHVRDTVDLRSVVDAATTMLGPEALARSVTLRADLGTADVTVVGDPSALERVVLNVVNNAVKFTPAGGDVAVTLTVRGEMAVVTVVDTGIGIAADERNRVFDRFFRGSNAAHGGIRGTGLGLAISRSIIEDHGGAITLRSAEGQGTTVEITLRRASGRARPVSGA